MKEGKVRMRQIKRVLEKIFLPWSVKDSNPILGTDNPPASIKAKQS